MPAVSIAREQIAEGSNSLDVCTAFVGRNEIVRDGRGHHAASPASANAPLVIDSAPKPPVIESGAEAAWRQAHHQLASISRMAKQCGAMTGMVLAKKFGARLIIALTIDETGMAKKPADKIQARHRRPPDRISPAAKHGLPQSDLMIDPLTFTIATGNEDDRKLGAMDAGRHQAAIHDAEFPEVQIILGLSATVSFGLNGRRPRRVELRVPGPRREAPA